MKKYLVLLISILIGIVFIQLRSLNFEIYENGTLLNLPFENYANESQKEHLFEGKIYSKVAQESKINLVVDDNLVSFELNGVEIFDKNRYQKSSRDFKYGEYLYLNLNQGENQIKIKSLNQAGQYSIKIKKLFTYFEMFVAFFTIFVPLFALIFFKLFEFIRYRLIKGFGNFTIDMALAIVIIGAILRVIFYFNHSYLGYSHDLTAHIEFIEFFAKYFEIPTPHKALEFPQQPFYYFLMGIVYKLTNSMWFVGFCSVIFSIIALIYAYKSVKLLSDNSFIQSVTLTFLAFTPSIVYLSSRINNDSLNFTLAILSTYFIIKSYKEGFINHFYKALIFSSLLFLTKISSATILLFFMVLLFCVYFENIKELNKEAITNRLFVFGAVSFLLLAFTFLRVYLPVEGEFRLVESYRYPNQTINDLSLNYFFSFNFEKLLEYSQSYVFESKGNEVRYSFLTYQFATMLFGEFNYRALFNQITILNPLMQLIYIGALIYVVGFVSYWLFFKKSDFLSKIISIVWVVNLILVLKFIFSYPSICNTDFRYYTPSFLILGYMFAVGLSHITILKRFFIYGLSILAICESLFILSV